MRCGATWSGLVACGAAFVLVLARATPGDVLQGPGETAASDQESTSQGLWTAAADAIGDAASNTAGAAPLPDRDAAPGLPDAPAPQINVYSPMTGKGRLEWVAVKTLGPVDLMAGVVWSGYGTAVNKPREDGPHWGGFAERYAVRLTGIATSTVMEASIGALWGEDPRYKSASGEKFGARVASVIEQTFVTRRRDGHFAPAYARYIAVPASNFLSNSWRPNSEADSYHAGIRTLEGFGGVLGSNTWDEFWPSVRDRLFHRRQQQ